MITAENKDDKIFKPRVKRTKCILQKTLISALYIDLEIFFDYLDIEVFCCFFYGITFEILKVREYPYNRDRTDLCYDFWISIFSKGALRWVAIMQNQKWGSGLDS